MSTTGPSGVTGRLLGQVAVYCMGNRQQVEDVQAAKEKAGRGHRLRLVLDGLSIYTVETSVPDRSEPSSAHLHVRWSAPLTLNTRPTRWPSGLRGYTVVLLMRAYCEMTSKEGDGPNLITTRQPASHRVSATVVSARQGIRVPYAASWYRTSLAARWW